MNCQKCKIEIEERDSRPEYLSRAAEAHMADCSGCRLFGEERLALRGLVGELERVSAPADFEFRMRARLAAERSRTAQPAPWFNFSPAAISWPLAGCLALVVSASLYFQQQRPDTPAAPPVEQSRAASATPTPQASVAEVTRQSGGAKDNGTLPVAEAASLKTFPSERRRAAVPARPGVRTNISTELKRGEETASTSLTGATPRFAAGGPARSESALIPVQLDAPEGQLKVLVRDTRGVARTISVDSVSFGSRDVMGRSGATYTKASLSSNEGVW